MGAQGFKPESSVSSRSWLLQLQARALAGWRCGPISAGLKSIWDVGARAKQTSLFLKFIPSLASGHNWAINVVCISKP